MSHHASDSLLRKQGAIKLHPRASNCICRPNNRGFLCAHNYSKGPSCDSAVCMSCASTRVMLALSSLACPSLSPMNFICILLWTSWLDGLLALQSLSAEALHFFWDVLKAVICL